VPEKNVAKIFKDTYWITIISLLKLNVPWDLIVSASDDEMMQILATVQAMADHEQEVQDRAMNRQQMQL
tara:strand:- start:884 stop:1090 length:207 start_codon:yes stop_codon:yes gene_type:complete